METTYMANKLTLISQSRPRNHFPFLSVTVHPFLLSNQTWKLFSSISSFTHPSVCIVLVATCGVCVWVCVLAHSVCVRAWVCVLKCPFHYTCDLQVIVGKLILWVYCCLRFGLCIIAILKHFDFEPLGLALYKFPLFFYFFYFYSCYSKAWRAPILEQAPCRRNSGTGLC